MVIRKIPTYDFGELQFGTIKDGGFLKNHFYIALPTLPDTFEEEKVLLSLPDAFELKVINRSYNPDAPDHKSLEREGCFYFNEENEWMLEAVCHMQTPDGAAKDTYLLRLPLSAPFIKDGNIGIYFDGTWIRFMKDGRVLNENSGLDCFCAPTGEVYLDDWMQNAQVAMVEKASVTYEEEEADTPADFYFPSGWNSSVGDVMSFFHNGVYHLMYLLDRRHHGSQNGRGAHYIAHLTTDNLIDWYEQPPIAEITKPWLTYGTGTMLFHQGKYYMSYGLHTERYPGKEEKITPDYDEKANRFRNLTFAEVFQKGGLPAGATYAVSQNGIDFVSSEVLYHSARNPSAYTDKDGKITVYCGYMGEGIYTSPSFSEAFEKTEKPVFYKESVMRNSTECPAFFSWNGYQYLMVGFSGYFRTLSTDSQEFVDVAALGENIYDGLSVPMVAEFKDNRRIMAGWVISPLGWGGVMMQRELIQEENGKLGMKWIPELAPKAEDASLISWTEPISLKEKQSYYLELLINPKSAEKVGISLDNGKNACVLTLDIKNQRMQVSDGEQGAFAPELPTMLEQMQKVDASIANYKESGCNDIPQFAKNYALEDIPGMEQPFSLKMMLRYSKRLRATVLDMEVAKRRTMISVRDGFFPTGAQFLVEGDAEIQSARLQEMENVG